ncbi:hypothetical protein BOX15_Mlig027722g1, partial [Macrostomum lignano]
PAASAPAAAAAAVFRGLRDSRWRFVRRVSGRPQSVEAEGEAAFESFEASASRWSCLAYRESGWMRSLTAGDAAADWLPVSARYRYVLDGGAGGGLSVHFADPDSSDADPPDTWRLFHRVEFSDEAAAAAAAAGSPVELTAGGRHLCSADLYLADYRFRFHGDRLTEFSIAYTVRGPAKDYVSSTQFQPA